MTDWSLLKTEYITSNITLRDLAYKYNVSFTNINSKSIKENWKKLRATHKKQFDSNLKQEIETLQTNDIVQKLYTVDSIIDSITQKIGIALDEINQYHQITTKKTKNKQVKHNPDKSTIETIVDIEEKELQVYNAGVNVSSLKQLTSALKDIDVIKDKLNLNIDSTINIVFEDRSDTNKD